MDWPPELSRNLGGAGRPGEGSVQASGWVSRVSVLKICRKYKMLNVLLGDGGYLLQYLLYFSIFCFTGKKKTMSVRAGQAGAALSGHGAAGPCGNRGERGCGGVDGLGQDIRAF